MAVVSAAWGEDAAAFDVLACDRRIGFDRCSLVRPQNGGQHDRVGVSFGCFGTFRSFEHHGDQVAVVFVRCGVIIDGAGSVGTVGEQGLEMCVLIFGDRTVSGDAPTQPVMGQTDRRDLLGVFGLVLGHPCHFGQRVGSDGGRSHGLHPTLLASCCRVFRLAVPGRCGSHFFNQRRRLRGGVYVVPQHRVTNHIAMFVENHHAVLLAANGQCGHVVQSASMLCGFLERVPPARGINGCAVRMLGLTKAHQIAGFGIGYAHFAGLGRRVNAGYESTNHVASLQWVCADASP